MIVQRATKIGAAELSTRCGLMRLNNNKNQSLSTIVRCCCRSPSNVAIADLYRPERNMITEISSNDKVAIKPRWVHFYAPTKPTYEKIIVNVPTMGDSITEVRMKTFVSTFKYKHQKVLQLYRAVRHSE
jgi:hypothetical protein